MGLFRKFYFPRIHIKSTVSLILLIITITANTVLALKIPDPVKPPKISLAGYSGTDSLQLKVPEKQSQTKNQFENDYVIKNGTDYVIFESVELVIFFCEANYPIKWTYPFPEQLNYMTYLGATSSVTRYSDFNQDTPEPVNTRFKSHLIIYNDFVDFLSVNFTCSAVEDKLQVLKSSIYVFVRAKFGIENEGKTLNVSIEPTLNQALDNQPPLVLPCRPAFPDVILTLEKEVEKENDTVEKTWTAIDFPEKDLRFDPKVGFILQRGVIGNKVFGLYRCRVNSYDDVNQVPDTRQFVMINVTKTTNHTQKSEIFEPRSIIRSRKASIRITKELLLSQITCCSGVKDKPPKLIRQECDSPLTCQVLKDSILKSIDSDEIRESDPAFDLLQPKNLPSDCRNKFFRGHSEVVVCRGENVDFMEEYTQIFHPLAAGPVTNRSTRISQGSRHKPLGLPGITFSLTKYVTSAKADKAPIGQKIILLVGRPTQKQKDDLAPYIIFDAQVRDLLDESGMDIHDAETDRLGLIHKILDASDKIIEYGRDEYYEGEPLIFMCFGVAKYYSTEPHLRINLDDSKKVVLDETPVYDAVNITIKKQRRILYLRENGDMFQGNGKAAVSIFGRTVNANRKMTSVDCWMPRIEGNKWDKISKNITVRNSAAPKFVEPEEENVYFYLGDVGNTINCTVKDAVPFPFIKSLRDGKRLKTWKTMKKQMNFAKSLKAKNERGFVNGTEDMETFDTEKNFIDYKIFLDKIVMGHQGVYQCVAKNVNGTAIRTVHIFVISKPGLALPITLTVAGIICAVVIGLGLKYWHSKRTA